MRRRFVQINGELIEVTDQTGELAKPRGAVADSVLWNDRAYQDMGDKRFKSRSQHRDYMKAAGVTTVDDFKNQWRKQEKARVEARQAARPVARSEVIRSIEMLQAGYKPRLRKEGE